MPMSTKAHSAQTDVFAKKLAHYKRLIDEDIAAYTKTIQASTLKDYGSDPRLAVDAFLEILSRGGKRIRGALTMVGYEMMGGKDQKMILEAARAIEMVHAYILIMDDIQDRSGVRRGGPTAHIQIANRHREQYFDGDSDHFGISIALNAMGVGNHAAQVIVANLNVAEELRLRALSLLNEAIVTTAHGQSCDIMNEVKPEVTREDIDNVLEWKTAHYTFLNPLTFGMVLAGADSRATDAVRDYSLNAGRAFQLTDDILGIFGTEFDSGKSPMDDLREGKRTLLILHALKHADSADKNFLIQVLGSQNLTQVEFARVKDILVETGALDAVKQEARACVDRAITSISSQNIEWSQDGVDFLVGLVQAVIDRRS